MYTLTPHIPIYAGRCMQMSILYVVRVRACVCASYCCHLHIAEPVRKFGQQVFGGERVGLCISSMKTLWKCLCMHLLSCAACVRISMRTL